MECLLLRPLARARDAPFPCPSPRPRGCSVFMTPWRDVPRPDCCHFLINASSLSGRVVQFNLRSCARKFYFLVSFSKDTPCRCLVFVFRYTYYRIEDPSPPLSINRKKINKTFDYFYWERPPLRHPPKISK